MSSAAPYRPRPILPTPPALVQKGAFQYGTYKAPFDTINPLDADIRFPLWPSRFKRMRLKEWQHFALVNDQVYVSLALFDAKFLALAQVCVYDRSLGKTIFHEKRLLPGQMKPLPGALWKAEASLQSPAFSMRLENNHKAGFHRISFDIQKTSSLPALQGSFTCYEDLQTTEPIVVCLPLPKGGAMYSHKAISPAEGSLQIADRTIAFPKGRSYGLIDIHKGFYPYVMKWHWATGGGYDAKGRLLGFNLTKNQVEDPDLFNENCLWVDGKLHPLPPIHFIAHPDDLSKPWQIRDNYGLVDLTFHPEVLRKVDLNALLLRSRYRGPYGAFRGTLKDTSGHPHTVDGFFGMCEDFYLRI